MSELDDDWCRHHFNYLSPEFSRQMHPTLARMRERCPVTHSDERGGFWAVTRYDDVLAVAQDWRTFSSQLGVAIPETTMVSPAIPEHIDPPLHREYKRLINAWFTPAIVAAHEAPTRALVTRLIDEVVEDGRCDVMAAIATPFPGLAFFELVLGAPSEEVHDVNRLATRASQPSNPDARECWAQLNEWIDDFVEGRRGGPRRPDVVDAIIHAEIEGRPVTAAEVRGMILLLILGGLETTAGALGHFVLRFALEPEIPTLLAERPDLVPAAIEELLRLEGPFVAIGRTVRHDTDLGGHRIAAGEKVLISFASANRDGAEFPDPDRFDPERAVNRHLAFGAGPHRCAGSHLARMNLRIAVGEIVTRMAGIELAVDPAEVEFHTAFNRSPLSLPITFTPGPRLGA